MKITEEDEYWDMKRRLHILAADRDGYHRFDSSVYVYLVAFASEMARSLHLPRVYLLGFVCGIERGKDWLGVAIEVHRKEKGHL